MQTLVIGDKSYPLKATPFTLFIYRDEFTERGATKKADIMADLFGTFDGLSVTQLSEMSTEDLPITVSQMMGMLTPLLQAAWAMAKSAVYPTAFPPFREWIQGLEGVDVSDLLGPVLEEAQNGFFRGSKAKEEPAE